MARRGAKGQDTPLPALQRQPACTPSARNQTTTARNSTRNAVVVVTIVVVATHDTARGPHRTARRGCAAATVDAATVEPAVTIVVRAGGGARGMARGHLVGVAGVVSVLNAYE